MTRLVSAYVSSLLVNSIETKAGRKCFKKRIVLWQYLFEMFFYDLCCTKKTPTEVSVTYIFKRLGNLVQLSVR